MKAQEMHIIIYIFLEIIINISCITRKMNYLEEKCVLNDFYSKSNIIITFNITDENLKERKINGSHFVINVYDKKKNKLKKSFETQKLSERFSFSVKKTGHFKICIIGKDKLIFDQQRSILFDFNIETSVEVKQKVSETADLKEFEKINNKMDFVKDKVEQIENMQIMSNSLENNFSKSQINISYRLVLISVIQIIIIFSVGIYHVYSLKIMFKDKAIMPF